MDPIERHRHLARARCSSPWGCWARWSTTATGTSTCAPPCSSPSGLFLGAWFGARFAQDLSAGAAQARLRRLPHARRRAHVVVGSDAHGRAARGRALPRWPPAAATRSPRCAWAACPSRPGGRGRRSRGQRARSRTWPAWPRRWRAAGGLAGGAPRPARAAERARLGALPYVARPRGEMGLGRGAAEAAYARRPRVGADGAAHGAAGAARGRAAEERAAARAVAAEAERRARAGEDFAALAASYSQEPGAAQRGGLLQPGREGSWVEPFWEAALALQPGEVSPVVETPYGYHVLKLEARRVVPFAEAARLPLLRRLVPARGRSRRWRRGWPRSPRWCSIRPRCSPRAPRSARGPRARLAGARAPAPAARATPRATWHSPGPRSTPTHARRPRGRGRRGVRGVGGGRRARGASGPRPARPARARSRRAGALEQAAPRAGVEGRGWARWAAALRLCAPGGALRAELRAAGRSPGRDAGAAGRRRACVRRGDPGSLRRPACAGATRLSSPPPPPAAPRCGEGEHRVAPRPPAPPARPDSRSRTASTRSTSPALRLHRLARPASALPPLVITSSITTTRAARGEAPLDALPRAVRPWAACAPRRRSPAPPRASSCRRWRTTPGPPPS